MKYWFLITCMMVFMGAQETAPAPDPPPNEETTTEQHTGEKVMVIPLSDEGRYMVDKVQADFIIAQLEVAEEQNYTRIVLEIDTFGGVVFAAREMTERLLKLNIPTTAYVKTKAISAGAFIAWACDEIVMQEQTTFGDAQMIMQTAEGIVEAPEKAVTVFRSDWKKSSDIKGRSFALAQGFFDVKVEVLRVGTEEDWEFILREDYEIIPEADRKPIIEITCKKDQLLTFYAEEMAELGLVTLAKDFDTFLKERGWLAQRTVAQMNTNQQVLRFIGANPWLFGLLVLVGLNGLYVELKAPGFGIPGLTAVVCFTIVFGTRYFLGTANALEMVIFVVGLLLCVAEIFVIPGFGIAGITGMVCMFGALVLASFPDFGELPSTDFEWAWLTDLVSWTMGSFLLSIVTLVLIVPMIFNLPLSQRYLLPNEQRAEDGFVMNAVDDEESLLGQKGVARGDLRPSGKVLLDDGRFLDVVTDGSYISDQERVQIFQVDGNRILVCQSQEASEIQA